DASGRHGADLDLRQWLWHPREYQKQDLSAILHDQADRRGNRVGIESELRYCKSAWRRTDGGEQGGRRNEVYTFDCHREGIGRQAGQYCLSVCIAYLLSQNRPSFHNTAPATGFDQTKDGRIKIGRA